MFIDDTNHIAHNCVIFERAMLVWLREVGGIAQIEKAGFVAPHVTIRNNIIIKSNCFIGQATAITKERSSKEKFAGNSTGRKDGNLKLGRKKYNEQLLKYKNLTSTS